MNLGDDQTMRCKQLTTADFPSVVEQAEGAWRRVTHVPLVGGCLLKDASGQGIVRFHLQDQLSLALSSG